MSRDRSKKVLIVSHDAGGAEVLAAYIKKNPYKEDFFCVLDGPADNIFKKRGLEKIIGDKTNNPNDIFEKISNIDIVVTSMSWSSDLEQVYLQLAKELKIKTAVYLDHWVNFRERFGYPREGWKKNNPDEFWVGDEYAYQKAIKEFPNSPIKIVPNQYFQEIQDQYNNFVSENVIDNKGQDIIFMSEPLSEPFNTYGDKATKKCTEYTIFDNICDLFAKKKEKRNIVIRFHPSEKSEKYDQIIEKYKDEITIKKSHNKDILFDVARAKYIIGLESMVLVITYLCGKPTVSFLPTDEVTCPLPFEDIKKIKTEEELKKFIENYE